MARVTKPATAAVTIAALVALSQSASAQTAVGLVSPREASRATGLTGEWLSRSQAVPAPGAWPTANNGRGWGVVGQSPAARLNGTLSTHFDAAGLTTQPQPSPTFHFDVFGNEIYRNPATGRSATFGVTIQRLRR
jgi:hypothetical protein